ncbi:hypothetical protein [Tistrella bauzanensis]|nr:hypothetical protein [Tistrella bauzanensis]
MDDGVERARHHHVRVALQIWIGAELKPLKFRASVGLPLWPAG